MFLHSITYCLLFFQSNGEATLPVLIEKTAVDETMQVVIQMNLTGEMLFTREGKPSSVGLKAEAKHSLIEKVLLLKNGLPGKVARNYAVAHSEFIIDGEKNIRSLRKDRKLFIAQRPENELVVYSTDGALTREELELTSEHFDTLSVPGLLPGTKVKMGEEWKVPNTVVQSLCNFEGLAEQNLIGKTEKMEDGIWYLSFKGSASGLEGGASVKSNIIANAKFDQVVGKITELFWEQKDEREQGPINPASKTRLVLSLTRKKIDQPLALADAALVSVPEGYRIPSLLNYLEYRDNENRFEMSLAREWQIVAKTENHLVLRLVEKGDFICQATISQWTKAAPGKHLSPGEVRALTTRTPGWVPEKDIYEGEVPGTEGGKWVYRIASTGVLEGVPAMQTFYLVAAPTGEQLVITFSLPPKQVEKLGTKDLSLVGSIDLPANAKK